MAFNWEKGLLGAGLGALSGYDYMLKSKMKEEYETKMEEARAQRAENMQIQAEKRQQAYEKDPTNPKYQLLQQQIATSKNDDARADQQLQLSKEQFDFNKMNSDRQYGLEAARTAASIKASNRSAAESDLSMQVKQLQLEALKDPTAADIDNNTKIADWRYKKVIQSGGTPEQAAVEQAMIVKYGITKVDDIKTMYAKDPEGSKATREFIGKAVLESKKDIDKIKEADPSGESILKEYFNSTGKKAASVAEAENGLLQHKAIQAASVYESMTSPKSATVDTSKPKIAAPEKLSEVKFEAPQLKEIATKVAAGDKNYIDLYNQIQKENPDYYKRINNFLNQIETKSLKNQRDTQTKLDMFSNPYAE